MELELLPLESRGMFVVFDESNTLLYRSLMEETCEDAIARARESEFYDPTYAICVSRFKERRWVPAEKTGVIA